jgi:hypothetical protein
MYLLFDEALVVRSSSSILFFKIDPETMLWKQYHKLENKRGQIYFIKGNVRIQVTTDDMIYFYLIDKETFEPKEENRMFNFMSCSQLMFGSRVRYGISYKTNQPGFTIFTRKYFHNFKVAITSDNYEGTKGANLSTMGAYIMAEQNRIGIYDEKTFEYLHGFTVPAQEGNQILYMTVSKDEQKIGIALGRVLIKDHTEVKEIYVYKRNSENRFELDKMRDFENPHACITF